MNLGDNILKLRKEKGFSQEKLAEKVGVTRQTISNWELDETQPTPGQLKKLSKIFKVSIDKLLDNEIENVFVEKISDTEKLAKIIMKILKWIGIIFLILLVIDIISFIVFSVVKKNEVSFIVEEVTINCNLNDSDYMITIGSDSYFNCSNCSKSIQNDLKDLINYGDVNRTIKDIEIYFNNNGGVCE